MTCACLPQRLKGPLLLTYFDGLSHQAVVAALGLSAKAVEMRVYRAKPALSAAMHGAAEG